MTAFLDNYDGRVRFGCCWFSRSSGRRPPLLTTIAAKPAYDISRRSEVDDNTPPALTKIEQSRRVAWDCAPFADLGELFAAEGAEALPSKLYHYTGSENAESILQNGLWAGGRRTFATPAGNLSPVQAQIELARPTNRRYPGALFEIGTARLQQLGINPSVGTAQGYVHTKRGRWWNRVHLQPAGTAVRNQTGPIPSRREKSSDDAVYGEPGVLPMRREHFACGTSSSRR